MVIAPQENRKPGGNPGRYRHCMRGGSLFGESRSLAKAEKAIGDLWCASQENCLNEGKHKGLQVRSLCFFVAEKRLRHLYWSEMPHFFVLAMGSPPAHSHTARQLNITDTIGQGDPVRNRNNRPLLCWAYALSQRAWPIVWVYHALTGECSLIYPYLRINGLRFFICG